MRTPRIWHPYLIAAFPILFLFAHNRGWFDGYRDVAYLLALSVGAAALLLIVLRFIMRDERKAALLVSLAATLFFSYGHLYEAAYARAWTFFPVSRHPYLLATYAFVFLFLAFFLIRTRKRLDGLTATLNVMSLTLVLLTSGSLITFGFGDDKNRAAPRTESKVETGASEKPDIYYILLDSYQGKHDLLEYYGFDNTPFYEALREHGFEVPERTLSNYDGTTLSLPSALQMQYLHDFWKDREGLIAIEELTPATRDNAVLRFLEERGYLSVHIGHWHIPTFRNEFADVSHEVGRFGDAFIQLVVRTTALSPFMQSIFRTDIHQEVLEAFSMLESTTDLKSPKFVYAHIIAPHSDYVFGPNGEKRIHRYDLRGDAYDEWAKGAYVDQLRWVNDRTLEAVDRIIAESGMDPVIVIHSDHGNGVYRAMNYRNFTAVRTPGKDIGLHETVTPVNLFRLIFNAYFDAEYGILPDRAYDVAGGDNAGYDIANSIDITDEVDFE